MLFLAEARARGRFALRWLKWLFWDRELRLWWGLALVVTTVGLLLLFPVTCHERQIRWAGVVLQLLGFAVVLRALLKDRKARSRPTLRLNFRQALARRPRLRTEARIMVAEGGTTLFLAVSALTWSACLSSFWERSEGEPLTSDKPI